MGEREPWWSLRTGLESAPKWLTPFKQSRLGPALNTSYPRSFRPPPVDIHLCREAMASHEHQLTRIRLPRTRARSLLSLFIRARLCLRPVPVPPLLSWYTRPIQSLSFILDYSLQCQAAGPFQLISLPSVCPNRETGLVWRIETSKDQRAAIQVA